MLTHKNTNMLAGLALMLSAFITPTVLAHGNSHTDPSFTEYSYSEVGLPERKYSVFTPSSLKHHAPLVVFLHGCNQTSQSVAVGTRWNELAEQEKFVVLYPQQKNPNDDPDLANQIDGHVNDGNGVNCWNWFRPEHINRGTGEVETIANITREVLARADLKLDPNRVFIAGISAGAIMTSAMAANYPEIYAAAAIVAGCGYPACSDASGALAYQAMGINARRIPVIFFQGTADEITPYPLAVSGKQQWLGTNDLIDNGKADSSVKRLPAETLHFSQEGGLLDNAGDEGDTCVRNQNSPCLGGVLALENYPFTIERYVDANECPLLDFWSIHGLLHNYPGGNPEGNFVDPIGPNITVASYNFFMANPKGSDFERGLAQCDVPLLHTSGEIRL